MQKQIVAEALAAFVLETCDFSPEYEADEFVVEVEGQCCYVERKQTMFVLHVGTDKLKLPRP